jgi:hypothetical protein
MPKKGESKRDRPGGTVLSLATATQAAGLTALLLPALGALIYWTDDWSGAAPERLVALPSISPGRLVLLAVGATYVPVLLMLVMGLVAGWVISASEASSDRSWSSALADGALSVLGRRVSGVPVGYVVCVVASAVVGGDLVYWGLTSTFPSGLVLAITMGLFYAWSLHREIQGAISLAVLVPVLIVAMVTNAIAVGLDPGPGQPVYVITSAQSGVPNGWYLLLSDSHDPWYLMTCSGSKLMALPASSVLSLAYGHSDWHPKSLLDVLATGQTDGFGLQPHCPAGPPPSP